MSIEIEETTLPKSLAPFYIVKLLYKNGNTVAQFSNMQETEINLSYTRRSDLFKAFDYIDSNVTKTISKAFTSAHTIPLNHLIEKAWFWLLPK